MSEGRERRQLRLALAAVGLGLLAAMFCLESDRESRKLVLVDKQSEIDEAKRLQGIALTERDRAKRLETSAWQALQETWRMAPPAVQELHAHVHAVTALWLSTDTQTLVTGGFDAGLRVWSLPTGRMRRARELEAGVVALDADETRGEILTADEQGRIVLWNLADLSPKESFDQPASGPAAVALIGSDIAVLDQHGVSLLRAQRSYTRANMPPALRTRLLPETKASGGLLPYHFLRDARSTCIAKDGSLFLTGDKFGRVRVWLTSPPPKAPQVSLEQIRAARVLVQARPDAGASLDMLQHWYEAWGLSAWAKTLETEIRRPK